MKGSLPFLHCSLGYIICFLMFGHLALSGHLRRLQGVDQLIIMAAMQSDITGDGGVVSSDTVPFRSRSSGLRTNARLRQHDNMQIADTMHTTFAGHWSLRAHCALSLLLQSQDRSFLFVSRRRFGIAADDLPTGDIVVASYDARPSRSRSSGLRAEAWLTWCFASDVDFNRVVQIVVDVESNFPRTVLTPGSGVPVGRGRDLPQRVSLCISKRYGTMGVRVQSPGYCVLGAGATAGRLSGRLAVEGCPAWC